MFLYVFKPGDPPGAAFDFAPETTFGQLKEFLGGTFGVKPETMKLTRDGEVVSGNDGDSLTTLGLNHKDLLHIIG
jgi:hypothetical protein